MAELAAKAERYIGTEGGGMDQAIIFNAKNGEYSHFKSIIWMSFTLRNNYFQRRRPLVCLLTKWRNIVPV